MSALGDPAEVERSVREMLYGERAEVRAVPCDSVSVGRLAGGRYRLLEEIGSASSAPWAPAPARATSSSWSLSTASTSPSC
jgi:hypothetical protein